jgi:hypothetical protein
MRIAKFTALAALAALLAAGPALALEPPSGDIISRNIDRSAEKAFANWIRDTLQRAPHREGIRNIGILKLAGDSGDFTALLKNQLTTVGNYNVVILSGADWDVIEDELARTDPSSGWGDIMDKATIKWREERGRYALPETTVAADAILIGQQRGLDTDWLRARSRFALNLARVDTRQLVAGGVAEGESLLPLKDLIIYYKVEIVLALIALIILLLVLRMFRSLIRAGTRPR